MTAPIIRLGDASSHGGTMVSASGIFTNEGKVVCVDGDQHHCPIHNHNTTAVTATSTTTKSGGKYVLRAGDVAGCGAVLLNSGSIVTSD